MVTVTEWILETTSVWKCLLVDLLTLGLNIERDKGTTLTNIYLYVQEGGIILQN